MERSTRPERRGAQAAIAFVAAAFALAASAAPWTPAGPADGGRGPSFGAVATHPATAGQAMIVAGDVEGIAPVGTFFTSDGGAHWASNARPGSIADPVIGGTRPLLGGAPAIAYVAYGPHVLRSADHGRSWAPLVLPFTTFQPPPPLGLPRVAAVNPVDGNELVVIAGNAVARSVDGGASWTTDGAPSGVVALVVDWSTRTIHARLATGAVAHRALDAQGGWGTAGSGTQILAAGHGVALYQDAAGALFRSIDGGASFLPVAQVPGKLALCDLQFAAAPSARVYGLECATRRVLVSGDDGANFGVAGVLPLGTEAASLAVDAGNALKLYVATSRGVLQSVNGGGSFARLDRATGAPGRGRLLIIDSKSAGLRYLTDPPGPGAGFSSSTGAGGTWSESTSGRRLIDASRDRSNIVFGAVGDGQGWDTEFSLSEDGGGTWYKRLDPHGPTTRFGPMAWGPAVGEVYLYASSPNELGPDTRFYKSTDDGGSWNSGPPLPIIVHALAATQADPTTIFAGGLAATPGGPQLYKLADGVHWVPIASFPSALAGTPGDEPKRIAALDASSVPDNEVTVLLADPTDSTRIWAGFRYPPYVMLSGDGGNTWTPRVSGLGAGAVTSIVQDPGNPAVLHLTQAGGGIFRSGDRGGSWVALDQGLHDDVVLTAGFDRFLANRIYAATGSGLMEADVTVAYPTGDRRAIEFYHREMDHYFVSADVMEIAGLDDGTFQGWARTGEGFRVGEGDAPGNQPVCRFFGVGFAPQSSHFYTPYASECDALKANPEWLYEKIAFGLALPEPPPTRGCPPGTRALFRLWNANRGGAPNHRYTTSLTTFDAMSALGWIFEGEVPTRVFACLPH